MIRRHYPSPALAGNSARMSSSHAIRRMRRISVLIALAAACAGAGCVYRPTIQQGNLLELGEVDQVKVGMTRSQVRYLLGTPMVSDPFEPDRWDYVYTLQIGHDPHIDRTHFVVYFEDDKVTRVEKLGVAQVSLNAQRVKEERKRKAEEEAKEAAAAKAAAPAATPPPATPAVTPEPSSIPESGETPPAPAPSAPTTSEPPPPPASNGG
jgi:outer membrane protein assembly factor BamE